MKEKQHDMTRPPDLKHGQLSGPRRIQRPLFVDLLPPCNSACPAGENIQGWLAHAEQGQFEEAWQLLMADNPMPGVHWRVCYHPCETECNRTRFDTTVSIHAVERFLGDQALANGWKVRVAKASTGKRVLIVGAGPSGLSAAYHQARLGHRVEVHEAGPMAGGMMHFGIPKYRLPRDILEAEIRRIEEMGVEIVFNHKVEDLLAEKDAGRFDAEDIAEFRREFTNRRPDLQALVADLDRKQHFARDISALVARLRELEQASIYQDPQALLEHQTALIAALKEMEFLLHQDLDAPEPRGPVLSGNDEVLPEFRPLVEEYFRDLSRAAAN